MERHGLKDDFNKVANVTFAFDNGRLLNNLKYRGSKLRAGKFNYVTECETEMTNTKNTRFKGMVTPNSFYCTFRHAEARRLALKVKEFKLFDEKCEIKPAKEPQNIIWMNR